MWYCRPCSIKLDHGEHSQGAGRESQEQARHSHWLGGGQVTRGWLAHE